MSKRMALALIPAIAGILASAAPANAAGSLDFGSSGSGSSDERTYHLTYNVNWCTLSEGVPTTAEGSVSINGVEYETVGSEWEYMFGGFEGGPDLYCHDSSFLPVKKGDVVTVIHNGMQSELVETFYYDWVIEGEPVGDVPGSTRWSSQQVLGDSGTETSSTYTITQDLSGPIR